MNFKKTLPHLITLVVFLAVTGLLFSPLFNGKKLRQSDINNWTGAAKEILDNRAKGNEPLWTNSMFGGMPAYQISVEYKANLFQYVHKILTLDLPSPADLFFIYLLGFYFLLMMLKVDQRLAILGALAFAFSSYFVIILEVGHNTQAQAIGYMAPVIAGIIMTYRGRLLLGSIVTGIALGLELYSNHLQITYYLALMIGLMLIAELYTAIKEKKINYFAKASAALALVAVVAAGTNITNLMATQEYGKYSTRGPSELTNNQEDKTTGLDRSYITDWSYGRSETMTLLIPNFKGGVSEPISRVSKDAVKDVDPNFKQNIANYGSYFGDMPFTSGPFYVGAIICLLFIIGLFLIKDSIKWWLLAATLLSMLLAWGKHFMGFTNFFLDYIPGYDKFRTVMMTLVIAEFTIPLLAVLAIDRIIKNGGLVAASKKTLYWIMGVMLGLVLLIGVSPRTFTGLHTDEEYDRVIEQTKSQNIPKSTIDSYFDNIEIAREHIVKMDAWRTFAFLALGSLLIWAFVRFKFKKEILIFGLIALVLIDLATVDTRYLDSKRYVSKAAYSNPFPKTRADEMIDQDTSSYRVLNLASNIFNDASTAYYHQSIGGYHGAKLKRYKELIDSCLSPEVSALQSRFNSGDSALQKVMAALPDQAALNMLNAKYIIYNGDAPPIVNSNVTGNAWFVKEFKMVPNADAEILAVRNFNPATTAIIDQRYSSMTGSQPVYDSAATITLKKYQPNDLVYHSKSSSEQLAVFSEIYYEKGWNAYVDGKLTPHFHADYVLRAMKVPAGEHTIEFKFEPGVYSTGEKISFASSLLLLLFAAGGGFIEWKKRKVGSLQFAVGIPQTETKK